MYFIVREQGKSLFAAMMSKLNRQGYGAFYFGFTGGQLLAQFTAFSLLKTRTILTSKSFHGKVLPRKKEDHSARCPGLTQWRCGEEKELVYCSRGVAGGQLGQPASCFSVLGADPESISEPVEQPCPGHTVF